jgi:ADP-ribose pyrophosphatase YjhB (NUDIX family)
MRKRSTVVLVRNGKVLLVRDKGHHRFSLPGVQRKQGETTVSAVVRELYEELGLKALRVTRLRQCDFRGAVSEHKACLIQASGNPHLRGHELDKFVWWDMKQTIPTYAHVKSILKRIPKQEDSNGN